MIYGPASNWFALFSFHTRQTNTFWHGAISIFDLEKSMSNSWMRPKVKVTKLAQYPTDALPLCFTSIKPTIPEIWQIDCLALENLIRNFEEKKSAPPQAQPWAKINERSPSTFSRPIHSLFQIDNVNHKRFGHDQQSLCGGGGDGANKLIT